MQPRSLGMAIAGIVAVMSAGVLSANALPSASTAELVVVQPSETETAGSGTPAPDRARGLVWDGLGPRGGACADGYEVRALHGLCTHGPDRAEAVGDVRRPRTTSELVAATAEGSAAASNSTVPCYGDGTTGNRVQVVYAHAADVPDRFGSLAASFAAWTGNTDAVFADSASETGGTRHVRWVTDGGCNLTIQRVQLSTTGDDSFGSTVSELQSVGLNRTDRKYLVWVDATLYCGISSLRADDSAAQTNANNKGPGFARVDTGCWGLDRPTEAHELMHMLGGVQYSTPHTSGGGHCTDEYDRMCYADAQGVTMTYPCTSTTHDRLFDCDHDDYFSTSPVVGSYLATHWNTASSSFLESIAPTAWSGGGTTTSTTSSTSTTSTTAAPSSPSSPSLVTSTWSGTLNKKTTSRTYLVTSGTGPLSASLRFSKASALTLKLVAPDGSTVASRTGGSPAELSASVSAATYSLVVSGPTASYTLTATYPSP